jgi:hypothetical protein
MTPLFSSRHPKTPKIVIDPRFFCRTDPPRMGPLKPSAVKAASEAVQHYKRKLVKTLDDEGQADIVLHCLTKLERIPVNIAILQVRHLRPLRLVGKVRLARKA